MLYLLCSLYGRDRMDKVAFCIGGHRSGDRQLWAILQVRLGVVPSCGFFVHCLIGPILFDEFEPFEAVLRRWFNPLLESVVSLDEVLAVTVVRVFVVEDHRDCFVGWRCYDFDSVKSSGAVVPVFVFFNSFLGVAHFQVADPQIVFARPSFPFDEVVNDFVGFLASSATDRAGSRVQDLFDFKLLFIVNKVGRRWRRYFLVREGQRDVRGQELLVEARVNLPMHRELQLVGGCSHFLYYREGTDVFVIELLLRSWKVEVGGIQPDLVADLVAAG